MKKLEKMDGKLFESLKPNEMSSKSKVIGGVNWNYFINGRKYFVDGIEVDERLMRIMLQVGRTVVVDNKEVLEISIDPNSKPDTMN